LIGSQYGRAAPPSVDRELELRATNDVYVHNILEIANVGGDEIFLVRGRCPNGLIKRNAPYILVACPQ
jgi:hypothetical protein